MPEKEQPKRPAEERMPVEERKKADPPRQTYPRQAKPEPAAPDPGEPKKVNETRVKPAEVKDDGEPHLDHYDDPDATPVVADEEEVRAFGPDHAESLRRQHANFKPEAGIDWDDPEFQKAQATWAAEIDRLSHQRPTSQPGQPKADDLPDRKAVPPIRVVRPETLDQQTTQLNASTAASRPPGTGMADLAKVQVVATDPSEIQVQRPAGEVAQGNVDMNDVLNLVPGLQGLIDNAVQAALEAAGVSQKQKVAASAIYQQNPNTPKWKPDHYLKHYRNDVFPQKRYMRMHVNKETDRLFQDRIDLGEYIQFVNGHFFATDQRDVDQLEWIRTHPTHDRTGNTVIGGDPSIYVDDDSPDVLWCPECHKPFASITKLDAHRKATHTGNPVAAI